jgi:hypothetical protein
MTTSAARPSSSQLQLQRSSSGGNTPNKQGQVRGSAIADTAVQLDFDDRNESGNGADNVITEVSSNSDSSFDEGIAEIHNSNRVVDDEEYRDYAEGGEVVDQTFVPYRSTVSQRNHIDSSYRQETARVGSASNNQRLIEQSDSPGSTSPFNPLASIRGIRSAARQQADSTMDNNHSALPTTSSMLPEHATSASGSFNNPNSGHMRTLTNQSPGERNASRSPMPSYSTSSSRSPDALAALLREKSNSQDPVQIAVEIFDR